MQLSKLGAGWGAGCLRGCDCWSAWQPWRPERLVHRLCPCLAVHGLPSAAALLIARCVGSAQAAQPGLLLSVHAPRRRQRQGHSQPCVCSLKSANILLDRQHRAKLADVGLAKTLSNMHAGTLATMMATAELGTFSWAAPEVHRQTPQHRVVQGLGFRMQGSQYASGSTPSLTELGMLSCI